MIHFFLSAWRAGLRSRSIQGVLILGVVLVGVAFLSASFSPRQPKTVALDVGLSGIRLSLVLLALFWVQELVANEIQRRTVLFALTYPVPRGYFIIGRYLAIIALTALAAAMLGMLLWVAILNAGGGYQQGFAIAPGVAFWASVIGLWVDAAVVAAFGLWIASVSTVGMLPLALGLAFAFAGKSLGAVVQYLTEAAGGDATATQFEPIVEKLHWVLPDLSRLDWRAWPMYLVEPAPDAVLAALAMATAYAALMLGLAALAFGNRQFE